MLRLFSYLFGIGAVAVLIVAAVVALYVGKLTNELPDYEVLNNYEPPVTTRIHAADGDLMAEYARERRLYLPVQVIPEIVKSAFISAEDKRFYEHSGVDFRALASAVYDAVLSKLSGSDRRARGASGITQQVAKNFLLTSDRTFERKAKEMLLARRIESAYSKDKILELYLNEINFGYGSYGIAGAALGYFGKTVGQLKIHEMAYLAALPKGPNNYHPFRNTEAAIERRNYVLERMHINGYISKQEYEDAKALPLGVKPRSANVYVESSEYFSEEVRREIIERYGTDTLYEGGLSVRSTLNPKLQKLATKALSKGLINYDRKTGYHGPFAKIDMANDWGEELAKVSSLRDVRDWDVAVVLSAADETVTIGLKPDRLPSGRIAEERDEATLELADMEWAKKVNLKGEPSRNAKTADEIFTPGDVVLVSKKASGGYKLEQVPEVGGALVAMDPHTGRVLAMVGGFSFANSQFNRATQANRQPGSAFKPFVYAAALDNGYTPSSVVLDGPIKINQGGTLGIWEPKNYSGKYAGPQTLRLGIENSRNLMTVRLANDMGMPLVSAYAQRFGIYDKPIAGLASSLGSRETTVMKMVAAYSVLANGGKQIKPSLIDRIQDRYGKTIYKHDEQLCSACEASQWRNQEEPEIIDTREQVLDPMTAYQITSMMEGVVQRGTAKSVSELGVPIAGKTGTTNEERDAWFVGYSPDLVVGVFVGYDRPTPMGKGNTGGGLAAPIFVDFMKDALSETSAIDFRVPTGVKLYPIAVKTGLLAKAGNPGVIMEAFKPGTEPPNRATVIGFKTDMLRGKLRATKAAEEAVKKGTGGLF
ncbi:penicillin-binding protein 1A [Pseudahrensia aquimaris]|uniref:Penicillin-binding protein 1A n=1 Tax=Pseudahrensia aquimaris TaxID=744461 RepID=A0ABW3FHE0_9HYPH